ncbi:hypothetical protein AB4456_03555 [Vibrio splendidus]
MGIELKSITRIFSFLYSKTKQHFRDTERNQKEFFLPYYNEVENVMERHKACIRWLNEEVNSYCHVAEEDMPALLEEIDQHNKQIFNNAFKTGDGKSLQDMAVEIDNLVVKHEDIIHASLIDALREYSKDCYTAHQLGEYHFLVDPSNNILALVRDLKGKIPTVHANQIVE